MTIQLQHYSAVTDSQYLYHCCLNPLSLKTINYEVCSTEVMSPTAMWTSPATNVKITTVTTQCTSW